MVKQARAAAKKVANLVKSNRILMIVCVFLVMGLAITLINYLQNKTLERFASAMTLNETPLELEGGAHGSKHQDCKHINDAGVHHLCGHVHDADAVAAAQALQATNGYTNTAGYNIDSVTKELIPVTSTNATAANATAANATAANAMKLIKVNQAL